MPGKSFGAVVRRDQVLPIVAVLRIAGNGEMASANADFKFREEKNLCIFKTRKWLDLDNPILRVVHDADRDWQFLTGDQSADDIRLVALYRLRRQTSGQ